MKTTIKVFLRKIPLIAGVADCAARDHKEAIHELLFTMIGVMLPIFVGAWVVVLTISGSDFTKSLIGTIYNGELFLYCTSLVSPILYMATANKQGDNEFPTKRSHISFVLMLMVFSSVTFGLQRSGAVLDREIMFKVSLVFFITSIFLLYLAIAYKNKMAPKGADDMKRQERDFINQYNGHRR